MLVMKANFAFVPSDMLLRPVD